VQEILSAAFEELLASDANLFSQQLFDNPPDSFQDHLNAHDAIVFPRFGPHMTSASAILEYVCPEPEVFLKIVSQSMESGGEPSMRLPVYCTPFDWLDDTDALLSLQVWIDFCFTQQTEKVIGRHEEFLRNMDNAVSISTVELALVNAPPILFFELCPVGRPSIVPSDTLDLPSQSGKAQYRLKGIIYSGGGHFTACLIVDNVSWLYDGQVYDGKPRYESTSLNVMQLRELDGRHAHICVYALASSITMSSAMQFTRGISD